MFERYTEKARRAIFFARYYASELGADAIEPDHLLLALLRENADLVRAVLPTIGTIRDVQTRIGRGGKPAPARCEMPLSVAAKTALNFAAEESERLGHKFVGPEHLLLGLFKEGTSLAAQLLGEQQLTFEQIREGISKVIPPLTPADEASIDLGRALAARLRALSTPFTEPKEARIRKAVFPAAGLGTRFLPATKAQPKEMLPLVDKPLIQYAVEEAIASGIEQIIIVTGRGKNAIEDHFDVASELEQTLEEKGKREQLEEIRRITEMTRFAYVRQKKPLGLGHAVLTARDLVNNEPFAVLLGDDLVDSAIPCLRQMMDVFERYRAPVVAIVQIDGPEISRFGAIRAEEVEPNVYRILDMVEKPRLEEAPSNLAIIGRYILTPDIFEELEATRPGTGGEIQLTDAMRSLLRKRELYGYRFKGKRYDAGDKLGFLIATVEFALRREDIGHQFREYLKELKL